MISCQQLRIVIILLFTLAVDRALHLHCCLKRYIPTRLFISSSKPTCAHVNFDHCWSLSTSFSHLHLLQDQPNFDIKHHKVYKCSNEKPRPFPEGDNGKVVKIYRQLLKILFSTATELISIEFVYKAYVGDGLYMNGGLHPFQGEIIST